jgi:SRSO17 transposase
MSQDPMSHRKKLVTTTYYISNVPVSTPLRTFVWLSGLRWAVEQCFEESKTELGMDHYEIRKYAGGIIIC